MCIFLSDVHNGGWSSDGVHVENLTNTTITCSSTHLTSFAVLVDVSGASQVTCYRENSAAILICHVGYI